MEERVQRKGRIFKKNDLKPHGFRYISPKKFRTFLYELKAEEDEKSEERQHPKRN